MAAVNLSRPVPALVTLASLVLAPNAIGLCARAFPGFFRRVSSWIYPSAQTELLSILVIVLVFAVTFYLSLTIRTRAKRQRAKREAARDTRRRFLPPLEIALLQLGNVSFLVFALILLVLSLELLFSILRSAVASPALAANNFGKSLAIASLGMLLALRPSSFRTQSWATLFHAWLPWSTLLAIAVASFGLVDAVGGRGPLKIHLAISDLDPGTMTLLYIALVACLGLGQLVARIGRAKAPTPGTRRPLAWFAPSLILAGSAAFGLSALFLHGVFLTLHGHLGDL